MSMVAIAAKENSISITLERLDLVLARSVEAKSSLGQIAIKLNLKISPFGNINITITKLSGAKRG